MPKPHARTLDELPMFATDAEIAHAIVGPVRAEQWRKERLPTLAAKPGFPAVDAVHGGRPVALVKRFYDEYLRQTGAAPAPDYRTLEGTWERPKRRAG